MENHYHTILRTRPDIAARWSDHEVARRWLILFPRKGKNAAAEDQIHVLAGCPERIAELRHRLGNLSWFMGQLNEFIARAANKEDNAKGRFWEERFKCQALLDVAAIAACMVYVDLNPIRAGLAETPEDSDFTSIQERIRTWSRDTVPVSSESTEGFQHGNDLRNLEECPAFESLRSDFGDISSTGWLCPIQSDFKRQGALQMTETEYFDLVDRSGRILRLGKRGSIDADLAPILLRIGAKPEAWMETVSRFGSKFGLAAGWVSSLRQFADKLGQRWIMGVTMAQKAFASPLTA